MKPIITGDWKLTNQAIESHCRHWFTLNGFMEYITGLEIAEVTADFSTIYPTRKKPLKRVETYSGKLLKPEDYEDVPIETEDYATVMLRFNNGNKGVVTVSQVSAGRKNQLRLEIAGSVRICLNRRIQINFGLAKKDAANEILLRDPSIVHEDSRNLISFPGGHNEGFPDMQQADF